MWVILSGFKPDGCHLPLMHPVWAGETGKTVSLPYAQPHFRMPMSRWICILYTYCATISLDSILQATFRILDGLRQLNLNLVSPLCGLAYVEVQGRCDDGCLSHIPNNIQVTILYRFTLADISSVLLWTTVPVIISKATAASSMVIYGKQIMHVLKKLVDFLGYILYIWNYNPLELCTNS